MNRTIVKYMVLFLIFMVTDIFLVSNLSISVYIIPHIYPLFILLLPVRTSRSLVITLGFFTGFLIDLFLNTGGLHAAATTWMAFMRVLILPAFVSVEDYDNNNSPSLNVLGVGSFLLYASSLIVLHHIFYFAIEAFDLNAIPLLLLKLALSSLFSILLIFLIQLFTLSRKGNATRVR